MIPAINGRHYHYRICTPARFTRLNRDMSLSPVRCGGRDVAKSLMISTIVERTLCPMQSPCIRYHGDLETRVSLSADLDHGTARSRLSSYYFVSLTDSARPSRRYCVLRGYYLETRVSLSADLDHGTARSRLSSQYFVSLSHSVRPSRRYCVLRGYYG
ncbi:hypothetical protein J6590_018866 [Homalodisca vitripennis]|nr:hypothetical protein J6590_018866 [Homalodisca vitripennis]